MHYYEVAISKIVRADTSTLTYCFDLSLQPGQIVQVEVGKKQIIGIILSEVEKPEYSTKPIATLLEDNPLPGQIIKLALWMKEYYASPLATVLQTLLPAGLDKKHRPYQKKLKIANRERTNNLFNTEQTKVLSELAKYNDGTFLLHGITGSGKTEIYIEIVKQAISNNRSAIIIVPEIALTSQIIAEFSNHFDNILITHSKMTAAARYDVWKKALSANEPQVVIGPRSALFMPLKNIGAIIIDEAHEPSLKQEQSPKYSALRAGTMLGRFHSAKVIFGSATPSIADRYLAEKSDRPILQLNRVARPNSLPPTVTLIDMTKKNSVKNHRFLSRLLIDKISETLAAGHQVMIFHNRRGSASISLCKNCGWKAECQKCFLPLTLHADKHQLCCHICGYKQPILTACPICQHTDINFNGIGTKLIEAELRKIFKDANIARFDADNADKDTVNVRYDELYSGTVNIIIGTQVIAKGLDLPHLRLIGIVQADSGLALPDYYTNERVFQLLTQVIGRVGRNEHETEVILQTFQPNHPSIKHSLTQDYEAFYKETTKERQRGCFPPFTHLLKLTCVYKTEAAAIRNSRILAEDLRAKLNKEVQVLGPTPAFYERQNDTYRWQLILKSPKREYLLNAIKLLPAGPHWQHDIDPASLL